jgi:hypothetical protein
MSQWSRVQALRDNTLGFCRDEVVAVVHLICETSATGDGIMSEPLACIKCMRLMQFYDQCTS